MPHTGSTAAAGVASPTAWAGRAVAAGGGRRCRRGSTRRPRRACWRRCRARPGVTIRCRVTSGRRRARRRRRRPASDWRPGRRTRRPARTAAARSLLVATVRRDDDRRRAVGHLADPMPSRSRAPSRASTSARAIGLSPNTATSGAGRCGSRKISSVPPLRHGLWAITLPGTGSSGSGVMRSTTDSPESSTRERLGSHRRLGALAADEPVDRAVGEHDRLVAGMCAVGRSASTTRACTYGTRCPRSAARRPRARRAGLSGLT